MRDIKKIIFHCSASDLEIDDSIEAVTLLHTSSKEGPKIQWGKYLTTGKSFSEIGYQFLILKNGEIKEGRDISKPGAHCYGQNHDSIGICLSGENDFTRVQFESLRILTSRLLDEYNLDWESVFPHNHFDKNKTCPNFEIEEIFNHGIISR